MEKKRFSIIVAVFLILIRDGKVLLLRRFQTGHQDGNYSLIAGHLDPNESITEAIKREAKEEAGIRIAEKDLHLVHVVHRVSEERINFFFTVDHFTGEPYNAEPERCDDMQWFPRTKLPENTVPYVKKALQNYQKNIIYADFR